MTFAVQKTAYKNTMRALLLAGVVSIGFAGLAHADKGGKGKDKGHDDSAVIEIEDHKGHDDSLITIVIGDNDREAIRHYIKEDHHRHCPPGLAKKKNGCLPPGQAKKYTIGHRLPDDVIWMPVSDDLLGHLKPVPGYQYVQVDKDILLIGEATKKVIDAVTLISAVGN